VSEPKGRGVAWTEERRRSDEGPPPQAARSARRRLEGGPEASDENTVSEPVLQLSAVAVEYGRGGERVRAVDGVDLTVARGEVVGLVGESGCGKSTLARAAVGLEPLAAGRVTFEGHNVAHLGRRRRPAYLRGLQMVFQDPYESLNPGARSAS
jgi:ABC-type glutathione transport system ATPase component